MFTLSPSSVNIKNEFFLVEKKELDPVEAQEDAVEIGIDDLLYSSDEEKISSSSDIVALNTKVEENLKHGQDHKEVDIEHSKDANSAKTIPKPELEPLNADADCSDEDECDSEKEEIKATGNLQKNEELILNFTKKKVQHVQKQNLVQKKDLMNKNHEKNSIDWHEIYKTVRTNNFDEDLKKATLVRAPEEAKIVHPHEYMVLGNGNYVCNYCQLKVVRKMYIKKHIRRNHREVTDLYHCPYCSYTSKDKLHSHLLTHKNVEDLNFFQCYICERKFKSKNGLKNHTLSHMSKEQISERLHCCDMCEKSYKKSDGLVRHKKTVHEKKKITRIYQCDQCSYNAGLLPYLRAHIEKHHTNPEDLQLHKCPDCPFETKYKSVFDRHRTTKHSKRLVCEECGFTANTKLQLDLHIISLHKSKEDIERENLMKYRCNKCDYKTHRLYSLNVHKLNHLKPSEIQYFYCYHCNFKAKRKDNLKTHVLRHFKMDQVKFDCYKCDYSTKKRNLLVKHMEKHMVKK